MSSPATDTVRIPMSWDEYVDYDLGHRRAEYIDGRFRPADLLA